MNFIKIINQYTSENTFSPKFDDDGNQTLVKTDKGVFEVIYNGENRAIRFTNVADSSYITMSYDYMGRRIEKLTFTHDDALISHLKILYKDYTLFQEMTGNNKVNGPVNITYLSGKEFKAKTSRNFDGFYKYSVAGMFTTTKDKTTCTQEIEISDFVLTVRIFIKEKYKRDKALKIHEQNHHRILYNLLQEGEAYVSSLKRIHLKAFIPYIKSIVSGVSSYYKELANVKNLEFDVGSYIDVINTENLAIAKNKAETLRLNLNAKIEEYNQKVKSCQKKK